MKSSSGVNVVAVSEENFEELLPLVAQYQAFYEVKDIDPARNRRFFQRLLVEPDDGLQFLAYVADKAVGFATLYFPLSSTRAARFALMNDLYVESGSRGHGVGRVLIDRVREAASARGFPDLCWMTAHDNALAQKLYDSYPADRSRWIEYCLKYNGKP